MKKRMITVLLSLALVLTLLPVTAFAGTEQGLLGNSGGQTLITQKYELFEDAEQVALNKTVTVNVMNIIDGEYCRDAYINRFQIVLPEDGYINGENDCSLVIYDQNMEEGMIAELGSWNLGLAAGTYYVEGSFHFCEAKSFQINYVPADDWEKEINQDIDRASVIPQNTPMNGWIMDWDSDWYQFTLSEPGCVSFGLTYNNDQTDPDKVWFVELSDGIVGDGTFHNDEPSLLAGKNGGVSENGDLQKTISVENVGLEPGTYYLTVRSNFMDAADRNYQVFWNYIPDSYCETERNDTYETADEIPLNHAFFAEKTEVQPFLSRRDDADFFKIVLDSPGPVSLSMVPERDGSFKFDLINSETEAVIGLEMECKAGEATTTRKVGLPAGTYYLKAYYPGNVPYYLTVNYEATDLWEKEDNEEYENATPITPGITMHGRIGNYIGGWTFDNHDCFVFTLTEPGYINARLGYQYHDDEENQNRDFHLSLDVKDTAITAVTGDCGADSDTRNGCSINKVGLDPGTYYLVVYSDSGTDSVDNYYDLTLDFVPTQYTETELNNEFATADPVVLDQDYMAQSLSDDQDCFVFTIPEARSVSFSVVGEAESEYYFDVYRTEEEFVEGVSLEEAAANLVHTTEAIALPAGTYYLVTSGTTNVPYSFRINYANQPVPEPEIREISLNQEEEFSSEDGSKVIFRFVPEHSLMYRITLKESDENLFADIYDEDGNVVGKQYINGSAGNYYRLCKLEEGETYDLHFDKDGDDAFSGTVEISIEYATATLDANGGYFRKVGTRIVTQSEEQVKFGETVTPTRQVLNDDPGQVFVGWFTEPEGGEEYDPDQEVYDNFTLYAHWEAKEIRNGLYNEDGKWKYFENDVFTKKTGIVLRPDNGKWYYVEKGVYKKSTGLAKNLVNSKWYYVENGVFSKKTGVVGRINDGALFYVKSGVYDKSFTGLAQGIGTETQYNIQKGQLNKVTGVYKVDNAWRYFVDGVFTKATGIAQRPDNKQWYYIENGVFKKSTGIAKQLGNGKYYYVEKGVYKKATGAAKQIANGKWYYVEKGCYKKATGLAKRMDNNDWYYFKSGSYYKFTGQAKKIGEDETLYNVKDGKMVQ